MPDLHKYKYSGFYIFNLFKNLTLVIPIFLTLFIVERNIYKNAGNFRVLVLVYLGVYIQNTEFSNDFIVKPLAV